MELISVEFTYILNPTGGKLYILTRDILGFTTLGFHIVSFMFGWPFLKGGILTPV